MHLMRVLESGLDALAKHLDVPSGENWNSVLGAIEGKLREVRRKIDGRDEEQWAAEAGVHLRSSRTLGVITRCIRSSGTMKTGGPNLRAHSCVHAASSREI